MSVCSTLHDSPDKIPNLTVHWELRQRSNRRANPQPKASINGKWEASEEEEVKESQDEEDKHPQQGWIEESTVDSTKAQHIRA